MTMIDSILKIGLAACSLFLGMGVSESHALDAGVPDGKCSSLPAEKRASVIASISKMSIGDSKRDVFAATGKPALVVEQYSKTARSAEGSPRTFFSKNAAGVTGSMWMTTTSSSCLIYRTG